MVFALKKRSFLFVVISLLLAEVCSAQSNSTLSTLQKKLTTAQTLKEKAIIYSDISWEYRFESKKKSLEFAELGLLTYQKINDKEGIAMSYQDYGNTYYANGEYNEALRYYFISLNLLEKSNLKMLSGKTLSKISILYNLLDNKVEATKYAIKAVKISGELNNLQGMIMGYNSLGEIYASVGDQQQALAASQKSYSASIKLGTKTFIGISAMGVSARYYERNDYKNAIAYAKIALANKNASEDPINFFNAKANLITYYVDDKQFDLANKEINEVMAYVRSSNNLAVNAKILCSIGSSQMGMKQYAKAKSSLNEALILARKSKQKYWEQQTLSHLNLLYNNLGKVDSAYYTFKSYTQLKDSLNSEENKKSINNLYVKYETEKKQQQIILLNNANKIQKLELNKGKLELENQALENDKNVFKIGAQELLLQKNKVELARKQVEAKSKAQQIKLLASENQVQRLELIKRNIFLIAIAVILLVAILFSYLFYNRYKLKQEARLQAEVITQQDLSTKAVLNAEENERKRIAGELHDGLGQMFSAVKMNLSAITGNLTFDDEQSKEVFYKTMNLVDESCREVRVISHQMAPNVLLKSGLAAAVRDFINKIDSRKLKINLETFGLQERIDQNIETVLYRVIQETVNNVIKHSGANKLDIQLDKDDEGINAMVEDNGRGFDATQVEKFEGIGLKNIRTRVTYLKGTVDFSSNPGSGTLIAIFIPFAK
jgi:two-component system NarL family sensor kinase